MQDFKKLKIWQEAIEFTKKTYGVTARFPDIERYGITSQLCRASSSIGANIAEGCGRKSKKDFARFLYHSSGSIKECEHFLILSKELKYIRMDEYSELIGSLDKLGRKINNFIKAID